MTHTIKFYRNRDDGTHRAVCSCGLSRSDESLIVCQTWAASHDLDLPMQEAPSIVPGFVSGLPDSD